LIGAKP